MAVEYQCYECGELFEIPTPIDLGYQDQDDPKMNDFPVCQSMWCEDCWEFLNRHDYRYNYKGEL